MKKFSAFFLFVFCVTLLSGCLGSPTHVDVPLSTNTELTDGVLSTAATDTAMPALPSVTPQPTATVLPPSIPSLISYQEGSTLQLTKPSPEGLLGLLNVLNAQHGYFTRQYDDDGNPKFDALVDNLSDLFSVIESEINLHYPDGFPDPEIIWKYYPVTNEYGYPIFPPAYLNSLTNAALHDLNSRSVTLKDQQTIQGKGYMLTIYQVELDLDPQPEWLVRMDWTEIIALSWLVLNQNADQSYASFATSLPDMQWVFPTFTVEVEVLQDFTGDGLTDIITLNQGYAFGTNSYRFYIARGTKDGFQELSSINEAISVTNFSMDPAYTIQTPAESKWLTLTLNDPHRMNWDCTWSTQTTYRWPYGKEQTTISGKDTPQTPECFLARAVSFYDRVDNPTAIRLLERAVAHFDQRDMNEVGKSLFAHYRLAILYALSDQDSLSRQHLLWFVDHLPAANTELKEPLTSFLEEPRLNAISLCELIYNASESEIPGAWDNYVDATAALHAYPLSNEIYPPALCPLEDVIEDKLEHVDLTLQPVPNNALADQGIPVSAIHAYPFPNQDIPASFMLVGNKTRYVAGYVPAPDGWGWKILEEFSATEETPQSFFKDVTGDGFPELAYSQQYPYWYCPENEEAYKIFLTTSAGIGFLSTQHKVCHPADQPFDITSHLPDEDGDGIVDWVADEIHEAASNSSLSAERIGSAIWFTPDEIRQFFSQQTNPIPQDDLIQETYIGDHGSTLRQKMITKRNNLTLADSFADHEWQRLTFLIAVSYEIDGETDQAIQEFNSLLRSDTHTLWGNLAQLHLIVN